MKEKVIIFLVGLLIGAIISTGAIYFYTIAENKGETNQQIQNNDFRNPGANGMQNNQMDNPPEMPNNNQGKQPS